MAAQVLEAGASGAFIGFFMGGAGSAVGYISNKNNTDTLKTENTTTESGVRYSIAADDNGKYVKVDTSQDIFAGKSIAEMRDIAKKIIQQKYKGKILKVGKFDNAYVNKRRLKNG